MFGLRFFFVYVHTLYAGSDGSHETAHFQDSAEL